ncbi:MAG: hypothetical protein JXQ96_01940 [Cyclobacteriaceae bacterium]
MKTTFLKKGLIAGLLLISGLALAEGGKSSTNSAYLDVKVTSLDNKMVQMSFKKLQEEKVQINIYDAYGVRVYDEKIQDKTAVLKKFDLSNLPAGSYSFEVSNDIYLMKRTVEVK